jgi:hypothetical protein
MIAKGAKRGDLPIEQPTKLELIINIKTAEFSACPFPQRCLPALMR